MSRSRSSRTIEAGIPSAQPVLNSALLVNWLKLGEHIPISNTLLHSLLQERSRDAFAGKLDAKFYLHLINNGNAEPTGVITVAINGVKSNAR